MPMTEDVIKKIADDTGISIAELTTSGLLAFLREKKRKVMIERLDALAQYGVTSNEELKKKIKNGEVVEHPAWEDLILLENIEEDIELIDKDIKAIVGNERFVFVTSASHMMRSIALFEKLGMNPIPAPTGHLVKHYEKSSVMPKNLNLLKIQAVIYEYLGWIKGKLVGRI